LSRDAVQWVNVGLLCLCAALGFAAAYGFSITPILIEVDKEAGQIWPAWLQAFGSVIAILVAVAVPAVLYRASQAKQATADRLKARSLGLILLPHLEEMSNKLNGVWDYEHPGEAPNDTEFPKQKHIGRITIAALAVPDGILRHGEALHELMEAGESVMAAVHHLTQATTLKTQGPSGPHGLFVGTFVIDEERFYDLLWNAHMEVGRAIDTINQWFPKLKRP